MFLLEFDLLLQLTASFLTFHIDIIKSSARTLTNDLKASNKDYKKCILLEYVTVPFANFQSPFFGKTPTKGQTNKSTRLIASFQFSDYSYLNT